MINCEGHIATTGEAFIAAEVLCEPRQSGAVASAQSCPPALCQTLSFTSGPSMEGFLSILSLSSPSSFSSHGSLPPSSPFSSVFLSDSFPFIVKMCSDTCEWLHLALTGES